MSKNIQTLFASTAAVRADYEGMVNQLFKNMNSDEATNIHAAVGMCGEASELLLGVRLFTMGETENIAEELGDWRFYMQKLMNVFGWSMESFSGVEAKPRDFGTAGKLDRFLILNGDVLDLLKKSWVYNKPLDVVALYDHMHALVGVYHMLAEIYGLTDEDIKAHNVNKLVTGPNARFKDGYTDAAAIARADKQDEAFNKTLGGAFVE